jgi:hypothetical protein
MPRSFLILAFLLVVFISGCVQEAPIGENQTEILRSANTATIRAETFKNCPQLLGNFTRFEGENRILNNSLTFSGTVIFEECGKNGLGGFPNSGPDYCYYGIQDASKCVIYAPSRIDSRGDERFKSIENVFNNFKIGQKVELKGNLTLYTNYYCMSGYCNCNPDREKNPEFNCNSTYFGTDYCASNEGSGYISAVPECAYFIIGEI